MIRVRETGRQSIIRIVPSSTSLLTTSPDTSARYKPPSSNTVPITIERARVGPE